MNAVRIVPLFDVLRPREIRIKILREQGMLMSEIATEIGVSEQRISQVLLKTMRKLNYFVEQEGYDKGELLMFFETPSIKLTCI